MTPEDPWKLAQRIAAGMLPIRPAYAVSPSRLMLPSPWPCRLMNHGSRFDERSVPSRTVRGPGTPRTDGASRTSRGAPGPTPRGAVLAGVAPFGCGDRLVSEVTQPMTGIGRNEGAIDDRQPQYLSSLPRKMFASACCEASSSPSGGAAVVVSVMTPPATSRVPETPTVVSPLCTPTKWIMWNL